MQEEIEKMSDEEMVDKCYTHYRNPFFHDTLIDGKELKQELLKRLSKNNLENIKTFILERVNKFINKVETGKAHSVETYKDMKEIRDLINNIGKEK